MERFKFMVITTIIFALPSCGLDKHQLFTSEVTNRKGLSMLLLKFITVQVRAPPSTSLVRVCSPPTLHTRPTVHPSIRHRGLYEHTHVPFLSRSGGC